MAIHKIICLPNPILRQVAAPIDVFDNKLHLLIEDMFETMYEARGVGLAAPQIALSQRLAVIDTSANKSERLILINPQILHSEGEELMVEGCLSVPGAQDQVKRALTVRLQAQNEHGKTYELDADGLLAEAIQHEIDHLNGKMFIDLLSSLKRRRALNKLDKYKRAQTKKTHDDD